MGVYDSTKYRIIPLMDYIGINRAKINKLLSLLSISVKTPPSCNYYGENEKLLKPPKYILLGLIDYIRTKSSEQLNLVYIESRHLLYRGTEEERDSETKKAKGLINEKYDSQITSGSKDWYIFEGFTHPDIFIESKDYVILCEGKWTEKGIKTITQNLKAKNEFRCQMIRHIQGALNYSNKKVIAFYIADEDCGYLGDLTKEALKTQLENKETIQAPKDQKKKIEESFYGCITWQQIGELFTAVKFMSEKEIDDCLKKPIQPCSIAMGG